MTADQSYHCVSDLMTPDVVWCRSDASLAAVAKLFARRHVHGAFVMDDERKPLGVISDFDLLAGEWLGKDATGFREMLRLTAGDLMTSPVRTIRDDAAASLAAKQMRELVLSRLLVVNEHGAAVGVIAVSDLVAPLGRSTPNPCTARDIMSHAIVTCPPGATPSAVARNMTELRSRAAIVVDRQGQAVGVVTGTDLLRMYLSDTPPVTTIADLMTTPAFTIEPDCTVAAAAERMVEREVHRLVVVDPSASANTPIGIIGTADIIAEMADECSAWQRAQGDAAAR